MRQIAYPAALGSCCVLGSGSAPLSAAEWSLTPNYSASVDYNNNRRLIPDDKGTDASVLAIDLLFKRALEDMQFTFEPRYVLRRFTDPSLGNGDDRIVKAGFNWLGEQSTVNLTASYWDQSTLTTELLETGIASANTHRRMLQTGATWTLNQTERRALIAQLSYLDVSYYGQAEKQFPGYRYPSGSVGERFIFSERGSFTVSTYGSVLSSPTPGGSSRELGLQSEINYAFSERTSIDASIGESSRKLNGDDSHGTDASIALNHSLYLGQITLGYTRSLVPYGTGFLVEQQRFTATLSRPLTPFLASDVSFVRVQNNEAAVLLRIDRPNYNSLSAGLNWRPVETWSIGARLEGVRAGLPPGSGPTSVNGWNSSVTVTWYPFPKSRSW
jgi:hypothetical protein